MPDSPDFNHPPSLTKHELDEAIHSFDTIQGELNYRQAQTALRDLVAGLDLTAQERRGLEPEITGLESMLDKRSPDCSHCSFWHGGARQILFVECAVRRGSI